VEYLKILIVLLCFVAFGAWAAWVSVRGKEREQTGKKSSQRPPTVTGT